MIQPSRARRAFLFAALGLWAGSLAGAQAQRPAPQAPQAEAPVAELRVLFVGNSYCYVHDLPKLVADLAAADKSAPKLVVESVTPGGATLKQHRESTGALAKIRSGKFTHVVLQAQSLEALAQPAEFQASAKQLVREVEESGAQAVFYQTWARREGAPEYGKAWSKGSPQRMQAALSAAYAKAAATGKARVARVGDAWRGLLEEPDPPVLFDEDGSHPSIAGTYLAACVIFEAVSGRSCLELEVPREGLDAKTAQRLAKCAHAHAGK